MAIKIQGSTIIDDSRNIVSAGIATINTKIDVGAGGTIFSADANVSNDNILSVKNTSLNPAFDITGTGSVGIGITNPSKSLHVDGTGLLVASGSTTLFSVESFTPNSNVFEVYDRENSIILGVSTSSVGIGSTNIFTITPQVTQTAIGIGGSEILRLAKNTGNQNIFSVLDSGSSPLFTVTTTGDVGIGTTNPSQKLHVDGNFLVSDGNTTVLSALSGSSSNILSVKKQSSNPAFDITGIGSVGIGTTQPSGVFEVSSGSNSLLSVKDTALAAGANIFQILDFDSNAVLGVTTVGIDVYDTLTVGVGTTNRLTVTPESNQVTVGVDTTQFITVGTNTGTEDIFSIYDQIGGDTIFTVTAAGKIGLGLTNPTENLHINGGNVLVSNGSTTIFSVNQTGTNILSIEDAAGDSAFEVTSSGSVGIGLTNPTGIFEIEQSGNQLFQVSNTGSNSLSITDVSSNPAFDVTSSGKVGVGVTNPSANFEVVSAGSTVFSVNDTVGDYYLEIDTDKFVVTAAGDVGIGTTNPQSKLHIVGGLTFTDLNVTGLSTFQDDVNIGVGGTTAFFDVSTGNIGIGTDNPQAKLHVVDEFLLSTAGAASTQRITERAYTTDNGTLSWEGTAGQLFSITNNLTSGSIFSVNDVSGVPSIDVDADGTIQLAPFGASEYVGVGKTNPQAKLDVNGDVLVSGVITATAFSGDGSGITSITATTATNVIGTANRVLYNSGTDTTTTSANLTFDGGVLGVGQTANINRITAAHSTGSIIAGDDTTGVTISGTNTVNNVFIGVGVGQTNNGNNGGYNNVLGYQAGGSIAGGGGGIKGYNNIMGYQAGQIINTGSGDPTGYNNILGYQAGKSLDSASHNNILGYQAGQTLKDAPYNNLFGYRVGNSLFSGAGGAAGYNNVIGYESLLDISVGSSQDAGYNNFIGYQNAYVNQLTAGSGYNNGIGFRALYQTNGRGNNAFGWSALYGSTSGDYNIGIGFTAGGDITSGSRNIAIGYDAQVPSATGSDQLAIGSNSSYWVLGDSSYNVGIGTDTIDTAVKLTVGGGVTATTYYGAGLHVSGIVTATSSIVGAAVTINSTGINVTGVVTSTSFEGDGSGLTNVPSPSSNGEFYTGISSSVQITPLSYETSVFTFPSTAGKQYVIETINVANVDTSVGVGTTINIIASIEDSTGEQTYIAYNIPIVNGGLVDLLKNPIVAGPSDVIKMWTTDNSYIGVSNAAEVYMNYTEFTSTEYISEYASTVSIATTDRTTIYTSSTYPTTIESIHLANRTDSGDYPVSITITNGVTTTYLAKDLVLPRYSVVDILDRSKRIETNATIDIEVGSTSTIDVIIAGKQITS